MDVIFICSNLDAWCHLSMKKTTMRFKGHHAEKLRMTCKYEGYGLQTDAIFQKGYTYKIFMWNYPMSKTYLSKRLLPIDSRAMALFDSVEEKPSIQYE